MWETYRMVLYPNYLGAWLFGRLADASLRKLTARVFGTAQQQALEKAAAAAVKCTAEELFPDDSAQAEHLAMVVSEVFKESVPGELSAEYATMLEAVRAGIVWQLAVLDDASLTGTSQSSAHVLGVSVKVLARTLASHLEREIIEDGARGGALEPLASQLNHDATHMQGSRIEAQVKQLSGHMNDLLLQLETSWTRDPKKRIRKYLDGLSVEWTEEGPTVCADDGTVLSATEMTGLLDRWSDIDKDRVADELETDSVIPVMIFTVLKSCLDFYGRFPEEVELENLSTELARKYNLFWRFLMSKLSDILE
jgi:hypothetical protein